VFFEFGLKRREVNFCTKKLLKKEKRREEDDEDAVHSVMMSSSMAQSSWLPSGRYRRIMIGIFLALKKRIKK